MDEQRRRLARVLRNRPDLLLPDGILRPVRRARYVRVLRNMSDEDLVELHDIFGGDIYKLASLLHHLDCLLEQET